MCALSMACNKMKRYLDSHAIRMESCFGVTLGSLVSSASVRLGNSFLIETLVVQGIMLSGSKHSPLCRLDGLGL